MRAPAGLCRYDGRRTVVTGCASGIGAQLVTQLAELGAQVVGVDRLEPAAELDAFHSVDLADPASIDAAADAIRGPVTSMRCSTWPECPRASVIPSGW